MADKEKSVSDIGTEVTVAVIVFLVALALLGAYVQGAVGIYEGVLDWFYSLNWSRIYIFFALIFGIVDIFLIGLVIWILRRHAKLIKEHSHEKPLEVHVVTLEDEVGSAWKEIEKLANSPNPSEWNMAMIRADGLLDTVLKDRGYEGESMADRLKIVDTSKLPSIDRVWSAHRLRNMIVHGPAVEHTKETIAHAIKSYELALRELGALK